MSRTYKTMYFIFSALLLVLCRFGIGGGFSPVYAMISMSALYFGLPMLMAVFAVEMVTDCFIGGGFLIMSSVYISFFVTYLLTQKQAKGYLSTVAISVIPHFIITNFISWLEMSNIHNPSWYAYSRDLQGLFTCYVAALPYELRSIFATLVFVFIFSSIIKWSCHESLNFGRQCKLCTC